jgi:hypothetical protein
VRAIALFRSFPLLAVLVSFLLFVAQLAHAHSGDSLSGFAEIAPVIDGTMGPGEWDSAGSVNFLVNTLEGGTTPGTIFAMNDATNLYLAFRFERSAADPINHATFEFDNDHSGGARAEGDDALQINATITIFGFGDKYRHNAGSDISFDADNGGTQDGSAAFGNDGTYSVFEFSHPLDTADEAHDFSLASGDTVGLMLFAFMSTSVPGGPFGVTSFPSDNVFNSDNWADIVIAASPSPTIGGEILSIDTSTLFVAGTFANAGWIIPIAGVIAAGITAGFFLTRRR